MHARTFNMLHNAGDQHVCAIGDHIDLQLDPGHVFVDQYRVFDPARKDALHVGFGLLTGTGDRHILAANDIGRT